MKNPWKLSGFGVLVLSVLVPLPSCGAEPDSATLILHNGVIWTVDDSLPRAEAVAIQGDRIFAVGSDEEILKLKDGETEMLDLNGAFVVPGFNDNHVHFQSAAAFLEFNIMRASTQADFLARVDEVVTALPDGDWILGGYWGAYDQWTADSAGGESRQPFTPDIQTIQVLTEKHPLFIRKFDDSEFAANRAAWVAVGLDPDAPKAEGVEFLRDGEGRPSGIMRGPGVIRLFTPHIPQSFSRERRVAQTRRALDEVRRYGVTGISDMSDDEQLEIFRQLRDAGELTVRVHFRPQLADWEKWASEGVQVGTGDEWVRLGAVKGHIDGIMGTSTARFFEPYTNNPANRGRWRQLMVDEAGQFVEGKFLDYMTKADHANLQLSVHAIGDEANHLLLNYLEELNQRNGAKDRRFRLVHAQVIAEEDFPRLGDLGVVAEVQPFHLSDDMRWMEERIGADRCRGAYAFRSISDSGAILTFGSDWPGTSAAEYPINPMLGLYAAVTRQTLKEEPEGGWFPEQRISIQEAIRAYTLNTAYGNFEDQNKGSISPGKLADLAVLSQNLLEIAPAEIPWTQVFYTVVGGKVVYRSCCNGGADVR